MREISSGSGKTITPLLSSSLFKINLKCNCVVASGKTWGTTCLSDVLLSLVSTRLQEEILQKEDAENNLAAFRAVSPSTKLVVDSFVILKQYSVLSYN